MYALLVSMLLIGSLALLSLAAPQDQPTARPAPGQSNPGRPGGGGNRPQPSRPQPSPGGNNRPSPSSGNNRPSPGGNRPTPGAGNRPNLGNRPNPGNGNRPNPGGTGNGRPNPGGRPPNQGRPPNWGRPPQSRPSYHFRPSDRNLLRRHYFSHFAYINRARRPAFIVGGYLPWGDVGYITPVPISLYGAMPPIPPGYQAGYFDGYVVVYDPITYFIVDVLDLL